MHTSSIGHLTGVQLLYGIHLIGMRLRQACGSHRTYISQTCALDRRATLTGHTLTEHVSHRRLHFGANSQVDTNCPYCPPHNTLIVVIWDKKGKALSLLSTNFGPRCAWISQSKSSYGKSDAMRMFVSAVPVTETPHV
jgi:hypothetical protein